MAREFQETGQGPVLAGELGQEVLTPSWPEEQMSKFCLPCQPLKPIKLLLSAIKPNGASRAATALSRILPTGNTYLPCPPL